MDNVTCNRCGKQWRMDPVFLVDCPSCDAEKGEKCRRPSGHLVWDPKWQGLPKGAHPQRDIKAVKEGVWGECPGPCPDSFQELMKRKQKRKRKKRREEEEGEERQMAMFEDA